MPLSDFRAKFNNSTPEDKFSMVKIKISNSRFSRRSCACGGAIQILPDGRAVCKLCSTVFNDGGNTKDENGNSLLKTTFHYPDGTIKEIIPRAPPPKNHIKDSMRGMHKFLKACRA